MSAVRQSCEHFSSVGPAPEGDPCCGCGNINRERSGGIDFLRCILVFAICMYHTIRVGGFCNGYAHGYECKVWTWCVPGFAFISGYYGVTFRASKIVKLWVLSALCTLVPWLIGHHIPSLAEFFNLLFGIWYLKAYTILILLSPLINMGLRKMHETRDFRGLFGIGLFSCWAWLSETSYVKDFLPQVPGLGARTFATLLVSYVLAGVYREFEDCLRGKVRMWWMIPLIPLMAVGGHYDSPITLLFVVLLFSVFAHLQLNPAMARICQLVGAAGFAVYVLHTNSIVFSLIAESVRFLVETFALPKYVAYLSVAICVYASGIVIYWVGVMLFLPFRRMYERFLWRCDSLMRK